jgi:hypothetical protein
VFAEAPLSREEALAAQVFFQPRGGAARAVATHSGGGGGGGEPSAAEQEDAMLRAALEASAREHEAAEAARAMQQAGVAAAMRPNEAEADPELAAAIAASLADVAPLPPPPPPGHSSATGERVTIVLDGGDGRQDVADADRRIGANADAPILLSDDDDATIDDEDAGGDDGMANEHAPAAVGAAVVEPSLPSAEELRMARLRHFDLCLPLSDGEHLNWGGGVIS